MVGPLLADGLSVGVLLWGSHWQVADIMLEEGGGELTRGFGDGLCAQPDAIPLVGVHVVIGELLNSPAQLDA